MTIFLRIVLGMAVVLLPLDHRCIAADNGAILRGIGTVKMDFANFYLDWGNLAKLGIGVAGAAASANTGMDRYIRNKYQNDLRSTETDDIAQIFNLSAADLTIVLVSAYAGT